MRTLEPLKVPSHTDPGAGGGLTSRREPESVHDFGSTALMLHILLSSRRDSWNTGPEGSETRIYANVERNVWKDDLKAHTIQVVDEPYQVLALQVCDSILILFPAKEVTDLLVKLG